MKATQILLLGIVTATMAFAAPEQRDGTWWISQNVHVQAAWAIGWMDGYAVGKTAAQNAPFTGMTSGQLLLGLDQFYASDYRNLPIGVSEAAEFVAQFRQGTMMAEIAAARIQSLRKEANAAH